MTKKGNITSATQSTAACSPVNIQAQDFICWKTNYSITRAM